MELKECPFCGGKAELVTRGNNWDRKKSAEISCKTCRVKMTVSAIRNGLEWCKQTVSTQWNNRITTPPLNT